MSNGYIQITLGGKLRGLKFGMLAVEGIVQDGIKMKEKNEPASVIHSVYNLVYHGLLNNCEAKRVDPDFTFEDAMDWTDELSMSEEGKQALQSVSETFINSRALQIMNAKAEEVLEDAKKKNLQT